MHLFLFDRPLSINSFICSIFSTQVYICFTYLFFVHVSIYLSFYSCMFLFPHTITNQPWPFSGPHRRRVPGASSTRPAARPPKGKRWSPSRALPTARAAQCSTPFGRCHAVVTPNGELHRKKKGCMICIDM